MSTRQPTLAERRETYNRELLAKLPSAAEQREQRAKYVSDMQARLPTPDALREKLKATKVLYRHLDMALWSLPYEMREGIGQTPRHLHDRYHYDWIYLGSPGWWQFYTLEHQAVITEFLEPWRKAGVVPGNPYEWCSLSTVE